ncbi:MAG: lamin tail domain-containing protein [Candidatus Altiarchaeota archaeon]
MNQKHKKKILPAALTLLIVGLIAISGPASAITAYLSDIADAVLGGAVTIIGSVTVTDNEFLQDSSNVNLTINLPPANGSSFWCALPKTTGSSTVTCSNGQMIDVAASTASTWGYTGGYGYLYGYAYQAYAYAYGYGYSVDNGSQYIWTGSTLNYTITWIAPFNRFTNVSYPAGVYNATITVTGGTSSDVKIFTVAALPSQANPTIVISEIMATPTGNDDAAMPGGEWVELRWISGSDINVSDWTLTEGAGYSITINNNRINTSTDSLVMGSSNPYLVVYRNSASSFNLNDNADTITLKDDGGNTIDIVSYNATEINSSWTNIPDGYSLGLSATGLWEAFTEATPGDSNPGVLAEEVIDYGFGTSWNFIALPVNVTMTAAEFLAATDGGNCTDVAKYNKGTGSWDQYNVDVGLGDYSLTVGESYFVSCNATDSISVTGNTTDSINISLSATWNTGAWIDTTTNSTASAVLATITGGTDVAKYNRGTLSWDQYNVDVGLGDFVVRAGEGYFIGVNQTTSWSQ